MSDRSKEELERALAVAEEALRARDDFLRIAGHEIRSPLTAVQLQTDALAMMARQGATGVEIEERAARVRRSVQRLTWLVEEVVDLARVSGGRLALQLRPTDLAQVARRVLDRFADDLRRAGCEVYLDAPASVRGTWDAARLEHTLGTLLLAAMKSGGGQPIEMVVAADDGEPGDGGGGRDGDGRGDGASADAGGGGDGGGDGRGDGGGDGGGDGDGRGDGDSGGLISVRDRGQGLPGDDSTLVFDGFERLLAGLKPGSPILGLWLARRVVEAHGGRLTLAPGLAALRLPKTGGSGSGLTGES